jgi:hypothetical protein
VAVGTNSRRIFSAVKRFVYWCKDPVPDLAFLLRFEEPCFWHVNSTGHEKHRGI